MQNSKSLPNEPIAVIAVPYNMPETIPDHIYFSLRLEMTLLVVFTGVPVYTITYMVTLLQYHRSTEKQLYNFPGSVENEVGGPSVQNSGRKRLAKVRKCKTGSLSWTSEGLALLLHLMSHAKPKWKDKTGRNFKMVEARP